MAAAISVVDMLGGFFGPERIRHSIASKAPVDILSAGSSISDAKAIDFTADFHEVEGEAGGQDRAAPRHHA